MWVIVNGFLDEIGFYILSKETDKSLLEQIQLSILLSTLRLYLGH